MNILRVTDSMSPASGGVAEAVLQTSLIISARGHTLHVLTVDSEEGAFLGQISIKVYAKGPGQYNWGYNRKLKDWLSEHINDYDAVIIDGIWLYHSYLTAKSCLRQNIPYYVFPHGMLDPWFQRFSERGLKVLRNSIYWHLIEKNVVNRANALFFTCGQERRLAQNTFKGYKPNKEIIVGLGTQEAPAYNDGMQAAFQQTCPQLNQPYLLYLSRIDPKKGVDLLLKAYARFLDTAKGSGQTIPRIVIAGPGMETAYGQNLKALSEALPLDSDGQAYVHFPGMLQAEAKWGAFYGCDAFILPSHQENFGIVVAEALACGKPVLISDQINIWREIEAADAGMVESDTEAGCIRLLERWFKLSAAGNGDFESQARYCFDQNFRVEASASALLNLLKGEQINPEKA